MGHFEFRLRISPEELLAYYRGRAKQVIVQSTDGIIIQFPASLLTPFVTRSGVQGDFVLTCDANRKWADIRRLGDRRRTKKSSPLDRRNPASRKDMDDQ
ncbi:MAG: DUF2835 family protein [Thiobacillaceae bacterium]